MNTSAYNQEIVHFIAEDTSAILQKLRTFVLDADESQIRAWKDSIKILKETFEVLLQRNPKISESTLILEYTIPLEARRIDAVLLMNGVIVVIEFKGKPQAYTADIDQAAAYARDLRAYHKQGSLMDVECILCVTRLQGSIEETRGVKIVGPSGLVSTLLSFYETHQSNEACDVESFLSLDSYQPLPSLIEAARELFRSGSLTRIHRAAAVTEPTLIECSKIIHETAKKRRRALILICGVPGAGKTLVGLQLAHAQFLDDLSIARSNGDKPTAPAVFLSGNGPLVEVLQYELRQAGGDGKAFVRGVHEYVKTFTRSSKMIPPQHVLIYDEAQRAFDAGQVLAKHKDLPTEFSGLSEPELFIQFAERVPDWCVVVGLIGSGQEIHIGEEAGLGQWKSAIEKANSAEWDIYIPESPDVLSHFHDFPNTEKSSVLELSTTIRFHLASQLYEFVRALLDGDSSKAKELSVELERNGYNLRLTSQLDLARDYLRDRYSGDVDARYGMLASAKDKELIKHGIPKGFKNPGEVGAGKYGKWYSEHQGAEYSCTNLNTVATEFGSQGLELDAALLAWGTDYIRENGSWTNRYASGYQEAHRIVNAATLRKNAYRVLLTRGRDATVVFVPPIPDKMRETYSFLRSCGFQEL